MILALALSLALPSAARTSPRKEDGARSKLEALARDATPLYCGGRHGRYVALTFDDGPSSYTRRVLRLLPRGRARATLFVVGGPAPAPPPLLRPGSPAGARGNPTLAPPRPARPRQRG